ncbi:ABC transporter ATP-binding protein [Cellulomonas oligotrophica]|uniref:ABC-type quaternary amine transporter n=1 Tax=Cellulomonas oligotrophica TaxID=931536 RepID=A0A7Y9FFR4_9CELL|nr:ATP-binding cassette domain-containing protein [Cellulomonas oligotrophica]NYD86485.1 osmoprotectant transport system ATP-binding protein [Cellulomonas oligotrophica]GIG32624.1 ABC transporter ATP-binding protein [Cellulomonas oligotrophica]
MIELDDVSMTYPDGTVAVERFSLTVPSRTTVALVGSSGSGKTTLLRMVNRMVDPTAGSVRIDGVDVATVDKVRLRRSVGYVLQAGGLLPHRTVLENVMTVPLLERRPDRAHVARRAREVLDIVGIDPARADAYPGELSGGQQQRVGVARALAADPDILLMDEPFGAVDPIVRRELQGELRRLQRDLGKTVLLVTHDVDEAFALADHVVILRERAQVAQAGSPTQIMAHPADRFVRRFVGLDDDRRALRTTVVDGVTVLVDGAGHPAGVLAT